MRGIRVKIWLVIVLLIAAMAVSMVIYSRGGFSISNTEVAYCGNNDYHDTLYGSSLNGYTLFKANCAACHNMVKEATGPALMGAASRAPSKNFIKSLLLNPDKTLAASAYGRALRKQYGLAHPHFKDFLSILEINDVVFMIETLGKEPRRAY